MRVQKPRTGYHAVLERDYRAAIDTAKRLGFDFAQVDLNVPTFFLDGLSAQALNEIRAYAKQQKTELTFHAPGDNVSLFSDYPRIRAGVLEQFLSIVDSANALGARHVTFHTGSCPAFRTADRQSDAYAQTFAKHYGDVLHENLKALLRASESTLICVENSGFTPLVMDVLDRLMDGGNPLYLALDTAKAYTRGGAPDRPVLEFMHKHRGRVREIHIHDNHPERGSHLAVGDGVVDFRLFEEFLFRDAVYMNFEVRPAQAAYESKQRLFRLFGQDGSVKGAAE